MIGQHSCYSVFEAHGCFSCSFPSLLYLLVLASHLLVPKVIIAEPFLSSEPSSNDASQKTFVAAFAMPNEDIPNNTDLRNFLVPLEVLESVAGMRFLGAASSRVGGLDQSARGFLDNEAIRIREVAGIMPLSPDWVNRVNNGYKRLENDKVSEKQEGDARLYRHLCSVTSCRGL